MDNTIENTKPDHQFEWTKPCGHTEVISMWGTDNFESRKESLKTFPCKCCTELNRLASGTIAAGYNMSDEDKVAWLNKTYPQWRDSVAFVKATKSGFGANPERRNDLLDEWVKLADASK
jgi:hypothetical protein